MCLERMEAKGPPFLWGHYQFPCNAVELTLASFCFFHQIVLYSLYGLLQERIMKGRYGPEQEKFTAASLLVLCNRLFSMFVGIAIILLKSMRRGTAGSSAGQTLGQRLKPASPIYAYCAVAVLNFLATFCRACLLLLLVLKADSIPRS